MPSTGTIMSSEQRKILDELTALGEELGLYGEDPVVCVTHRRFIPCRREKDGTCFYSSSPEEAEKVRRYQSGELLTFIK